MIDIIQTALVVGLGVLVVLLINRRVGEVLELRKPLSQAQYDEFSQALIVSARDFDKRVDALQSQLNAVNIHNGVKYEYER